MLFYLAVINSNRVLCCFQAQESAMCGGSRASKSVVRVFVLRAAFETTQGNWFRIT